MKKVLLFLILTLSYILPGYSYLPPSLPSEFVVKPKNAIVPTFYLELGNLFFGKVIKDQSNHKICFSYLDENDQLIASGRVSLEASSAIIEVYDSNDQFIGSINQEVYTFRPAKYKIYNEKQEFIAVGEMNWLGSRFQLVNPSNLHEEWILYSRPYFKLINDYWYVKIYDTRHIDPRLVVMLAAFQADLDNKTFPFSP